MACPRCRLNRSPNESARRIVLAVGKIHTTLGMTGHCYDRVGNAVVDFHLTRGADYGNGAEEVEHSVSNSLETINKPQAIEDSECIFGDSECGEPLTTQRVSLDFTPNDLDNDFVQRKCCAFWDFINSRLELKDINAAPDPKEYSNESESSDVLSHVPPQEPISSHSVTKTAVDTSMLEFVKFVEEKGLIDRALEAKPPKSYCENNRIPSSNESMTGISRAHQLGNSKGLKNNKENIKTNMKALDNASKKQEARLRVMCNKMQEWDMNHPKSMKPPGPSPALSDDIN